MDANGITQPVEMSPRLPPGPSGIRHAADWHGFAGADGIRVPPLTILQPGNANGLQQVLAWGRKTKTGLTLFSSPGGPRRRGFDGRTPSAIVDLSQLNRIHHIDSRDAMALVEPGVTFLALDAALRPHGLRSFKPLLARRSKSALASALEREPGINPNQQWDILDPLGGGEVLFGSGEIFRTGSASLPGTMQEQLAAGNRHMTALGPVSTDFMRVIQGSQGTLAAVLWSGLYCERIPCLETPYFVGMDRLAPLAALASWISWRRFDGHLFISNRLHLAMVLGTDAAERERLLESLPEWVLVFNLTAGDLFPKDKIAYQTSELLSEAARHGLRLKTELSGHGAAEISALQAALPDDNYPDRLRGAHRAIFFLSQLDKIERFIEAMKALAPNLPLGIYLQPRLQGRNCHIEFILPFDPGSPEQAGRTAALETLALERLMDLGALFSRPYGAWAAPAYRRHPTIQPFLKQTKTMFDPAGIMAPGRLCF